MGTLPQRRRRGHLQGRHRRTDPTRRPPTHRPDGHAAAAAAQTARTPSRTASPHRLDAHVALARHAGHRPTDLMGTPPLPQRRQCGHLQGRRRHRTHSMRMPLFPQRRRYCYPPNLAALTCAVSGACAPFLSSAHGTRPAPETGHQFRRTLSLVYVISFTRTLVVKQQAAEVKNPKSSTFGLICDHPGLRLEF